MEGEQEVIQNIEQKLTDARTKLAAAITSRNQATTRYQIKIADDRVRVQENRVSRLISLIER